MLAKWERMLAVFGQYSYLFTFSSFMALLRIRAHAIFYGMDQTSFYLQLILLITFFTFLYIFLFRFLYDGARIQDDDTPASLDMEDNGMFKRTFSFQSLTQHSPPTNRHY